MPFAEKLHALVSFSSNNTPNVVSWLPNGDAFVVKEIGPNLHPLLQKYFNHSNFDSLQRQLYRYGWKRRVDDEGRYKGMKVYFHPDITRDSASLPLSNTDGVETRENRWSEKEDRKLQRLVAKSIKENGKIRWVVIEEDMGDRSAKQCRQRWTYHLSPEIKKGFFSEKEDRKLRRLVEKCHSEGKKKIKWSDIAHEMDGRNGKQCQQRWELHLSQDRKKKAAEDVESQPQKKKQKKDWTKDEDEKIQSLQKELGNKWGKMVSHLPGRTSEEIRNRWNSFPAKKTEDGNRPMKTQSERAASTSSNTSHPTSSKSSSSSSNGSNSSGSSSDRSTSSSSSSSSPPSSSSKHAKKIPSKRNAPSSSSGSKSSSSSSSNTSSTSSTFHRQKKTRGKVQHSSSSSSNSSSSNSSSRSSSSSSSNSSSSYRLKQQRSERNSSFASSSSSDYSSSN